MIYDYGIPDFQKITYLDDLREELPTIFNNTLSDAQRLVSVIRCVNKMGLVVGEIADNWAVVENWIKTNGVDSAVESVLSRWAQDGTLAKILDKTALKEINANVENLRNELKNTEANLTNKVGVAVDNINKGNAQMWKNVTDLINNKLNNASIKGTFATLDELKSKYPNGADGVFLVLDTKHIYYWDTQGGQWNDAGSFMPNPLSEAEKQAIGDYSFNVGNLIDDSPMDTTMASFFKTHSDNTALTKSINGGVNTLNLKTTGNPMQFDGIRLSSTLLPEKWKKYLFHYPALFKFRFQSNVKTTINVTLHTKTGDSPQTNKTLKSFTAYEGIWYDVVTLIPKVEQNIDYWTLDISSPEILSQDFNVQLPMIVPSLNQDTNLDNVNDLIALDNFTTGGAGSRFFAQNGTISYNYHDGKPWASFVGNGTDTIRAMVINIDLTNPLWSTIKYFGSDIDFKFLSKNQTNSGRGTIRTFLHYINADGDFFNTENTRISYKENTLERVHLQIPPNATYNGKDVTMISLFITETGEDVPLENRFDIRDLHVTESERRNSWIKEGRNLLQNIGRGNEEFDWVNVPREIITNNGVNTIQAWDRFNTNTMPNFRMDTEGKYTGFKYYDSVFRADIQNNDSKDIIVHVNYLDKNLAKIDAAPNKLITLSKSDYPTGGFRTTQILVPHYNARFVQIGFTSDGGTLNMQMNYPSWKFIIQDGYSDVNTTPANTTGASNIKVLNVDKSLDTLFNTTNKDLTVQSHCTLLDNGVAKDLWGEFSIQGASSARYPKKNLRIKLFKDASFTDKTKEKLVQGAPADKKFNLKANYIDATQTTNLTVADLMTQATTTEGVKDETTVNWDSSPVIDYTPNAGQIKGSPVIINSVDKYVGLYTLNTAKTSSLFGMNDSHPTEFAIEGVDHTNATKFLTDQWAVDVDFSVEQPDELTDEQKTAVTNLLSFVVNATDEDFKTKLSDYYDLNSLARWLIFALVFTLTDEFDKNIIHATWDNKKFSAITYDLDTSFGLTYDGTEIRDYFSGLGLKEAGMRSNLFKRFIHNFYPEIRTKYWTLRKTVLSNNNILETWRKHYYEFPLLELEKDCNKWKQPSIDLMTEEHIIRHINKKMKYIDTEFTPETREDL